MNAIAERFAEGDAARLPALADEPVRRQVALVFAATSVAARAAPRATTTIPIVMVDVADPVATKMPHKVALALAGVGALTTVNWTQARADDLVQQIQRAAAACTVETISLTAVNPAGFDVVVNATSPGSSLVAEVVVVPEYTPLLRAAQGRALDVVRGMGMLTPQIEICAEFLGMTAPQSPGSP